MWRHRVRIRKWKLVPSHSSSLIDSVVSFGSASLIGEPWVVVLVVTLWAVDADELSLPLRNTMRIDLKEMWPVVDRRRQQ